MFFQCLTPPYPLIKEQYCENLLMDFEKNPNIGPAVLSSDMTSAYVLYFPAATAAPPPIFPNHTNYQII